MLEYGIFILSLKPETRNIICRKLPTSIDVHDLQMVETCDSNVRLTEVRSPGIIFIPITSSAISGLSDKWNFRQMGKSLKSEFPEFLINHEITEIPISGISDKS